MDKGTQIAKLALAYVGKTEKSNNSGFNDPLFEKRMQAVGWSKGQAWCSYFSELVWKEAYAADKSTVDQLDKLFSGSATETFRKFDVSKKFSVGKEPKVGAVVIWRHGTGWQGHAGIVVDLIDENSFFSVEGNTNDKGGREGYIVSKKRRLISQPIKADGLNLVGFIYPVQLV